MGIIIKPLSEAQPICNDCGIALCWSIDINEYEEYKNFWDNWTCSWCNPSYKGAYERYKEMNKSIIKIKDLYKI